MAEVRRPPGPVWLRFSRYGYLAGFVTFLAFFLGVTALAFFTGRMLIAMISTSFFLMLYIAVRR